MTDDSSDRARSSPPTIVVVHPKERRSKCTVWPLRERDDFAFWRYPNRGEESLDGYVRLGIGGPPLTPDDADVGLLVVDGTWRYAARMEADFADVPVRSIPVWRTAYPRVSKWYDDPDEGLATVEAIFAAYVAIGRDTNGLLDHYHWANDFLARNAEHLVTDGN